MVEVTKKLIVGNLQKNLEEKIRAWLEELLKVLWAQLTIKKRVTYETHFTLVYGTEAVLPTEARLLTITTLVVENIEENQRQLARNLDLLVVVQECE